MPQSQRLPAAVLPRRLRAGDHVRAIAPSVSLSAIRDPENTALANARLAHLGLTVSFGEHVEECDALGSSSAASRVADLHAAFAAPHVDAVLSVLGGFTCNEMLPLIDWDVIRANPKVFMGYSDTTALQNAITATTGLVTYSGPAWATFAMQEGFEDIERWFRACVMTDAPYDIEPASHWSNDAWHRDQTHRTFLRNEGWQVLQEGVASGRIVGGNLCTLNLLQGTPWMPSLEGAMLLLEDDAQVAAVDFCRDLTSLLQQTDADQVAGLAIGRFQPESEVTQEELTAIVARQPALAGKPVVAGIDIGHTFPLATFPLGGEATLVASAESPRLSVTRH